MKNPGKMFTREELKERFNFATVEGADRFMDLLEEEPVEEFQVMVLAGERVLVLDDQFWEMFVDFMESQGYWHQESD